MTNEINKTIHELRRLALIIMLLGAVLFASVIYSSYRTNHAVDLAHQANKKAVSTSLVKEQVCSKTNRGKPCQELFDRLAGSLTTAQRFRLGCDSLAALHVPRLDAMRQQAGCPPPIR